MNFRVVDLIEAKKRGEQHTSKQLSWLINGFTNGQIPDYQMSAWLMAVCLRGMSDPETIALTSAIVNTGKALGLSKISGVKLDKHSSGGVGDKVTLVFVPILSAAGAKIAKMSGHGLGHTGGTLDKLESLPGFRTSLTEDEIISHVVKIGACVCAQTETIVPADKAVYALRDVTGTVASVPLIASSIMSKKLACGADIIVLDIKVGSGAFMKTVDEARDLAKLCVTIGKSHGKKVVAFLTDMNQPLGRAVGNRIEVDEAISLLEGREVEPRFKAEAFALCDDALKLIGSERWAEEIVRSGDASRKFQEIVKAQSDSDVEDKATVYSKDVFAQASAFVEHLDALTVGQAAAKIGAGRQTKSDTPDYHAGIYLHKIQGEKAERGEKLATLFASDRAVLSDDAEETLLGAYGFSDKQPETVHNPVIERID